MQSFGIAVGLATGILLSVTSNADAKGDDFSSCDSALVRASFIDRGTFSRDARLSEYVSEGDWQSAHDQYGASYEYYGLKIGGSANDYKSRSQEYIHRTQSHVSVSEARNMMWTGLDAQAGSIYQTCVEGIIREYGLHLAPITATESDVSLKIRWNPRGTQEKGTVHVTWSGRGIPLKDLPTVVTQGETIVIVPRPQVESQLVIHLPGYDDVVTLTPLPSHWLSVSQIDNYDTIVGFVNQYCSPDDSSGILGSVTNTDAPSFSYVVAVSCRVDHADPGQAGYRWMLSSSPRRQVDRAHAYIGETHTPGGPTPLQLDRIPFGNK